MTVPAPELWMPWLFAVLTLVFVLRMVRSAHLAGTYDALAVRVHMRVAVVFLLVTLVLFLVL